MTHAALQAIKLLAITVSALLTPALAAVGGEPVPFEDPLEFPDAAFELVKKAKVVWLGEMHGTNEAPLLFRGLVRLVARRDGPPVVALEIPKASQPALEDYLKNGDPSALRDRSFFGDDWKDGRSSEAMFKLVEALRRERIAKVVCFDPAPVADAQTRDEGMAAILEAAARDYPGAKLVVLSGNVHSRVTEGTPWDPKYRPAAFVLSKSLPTVVSLDPEYEGGAIWACMSGGKCGVNSVTGAKWSGSTRHYISVGDVATDGHQGIVFSRTVSPSPPWLPQAPANPYESAGPSETATFKRLPVPLPTGTKTTVRQGAFGKSSHNEPGNELSWDFEVPLGTPVIAVGDGVVFHIQQPSVGGCDPKFANSANILQIKLKDGAVAQYLHIATTLKAGEAVRRGQIVAHTAANGWFCYPHVHFGVYASDKQLYASPDRKTVPIYFEGLPDGLAREGDSFVVP